MKNQRFFILLCCYITSFINCTLLNLHRKPFLSSYMLMNKRDRERFRRRLTLKCTSPDVGAFSAGSTKTIKERDIYLWKS